MSDISRISSYNKRQDQMPRRTRSDEDFSIQGGTAKKASSAKGPIQAKSEAYQLSISRDAIEASREYQRQRQEET